MRVLGKKIRVTTMRVTMMRERSNHYFDTLPLLLEDMAISYCCLLQYLQLMVLPLYSV